MSPSSQKLTTTLTRQVWSAILPITCVGCGEESDWLCGACQRQLRFHDSDRCFCGKAAEAGLCPKHRLELGLDGLTTLWPYAEPAARELIQAIKYHGYIDAVNWLSLNYQRQILARLPRGDWTVTAVPLATERFRARGFNQSELIAKKLTAPLYDYTELLIRPKDTTPQVGLNRKDRQKNLVKAFAVKPGVTVPEQVILVDDVITTGATLASAARVLRRAGTKQIWALTIAHG